MVGQFENSLIPCRISASGEHVDAFEGHAEIGEDLHHRRGEAALWLGRNALHEKAPHRAADFARDAVERRGSRPGTERTWGNRPLMMCASDLGRRDPWRQSLLAQLRLAPARPVKIGVGRL